MMSPSHFTILDFTLPETNSSPLKMDGWNTTFLLSYWVSADFQGRLLLVLGRVAILHSGKLT